MAGRLGGGGGQGGGDQPVPSLLAQERRSRTFWNPFFNEQAWAWSRSPPRCRAHKTAGVAKSRLLPLPCAFSPGLYLGAQPRGAGANAWCCVAFLFDRKEKRKGRVLRLSPTLGNKELGRPTGRAGWGGLGCHAKKGPSSFSATVLIPLVSELRSVRGCIFLSTLFALEKRVTVQGHLM